MTHGIDQDPGSPTNSLMLIASGSMREHSTRGVICGSGESSCAIRRHKAQAGRRDAATVVNATGKSARDMAGGADASAGPFKQQRLGEQ